jgi:hypothetical protein
MNWEWYWLGYSIGVNSRKRISELSDRITNIGEQGVITLPTNEKEQTSFFIGLMNGRKKIVQSLDIIKLLYTRNKGISSADILTLGVQERQGVRGQYIDIPVFIVKNAADNRGVAGFQVKLTYNSDYLTLDSLTQATSWDGNFVYNTSTAGVILAQGERTEAKREDIALFTARFYVKETVPTGTSKIPLRLEGVVGTGSGSELLTRILGDLYYITPIKLQSGSILLDATQTTPEPELRETTPGPEASLPSTGSGLGYDLNIGLMIPNGITLSGGIYATINVYIGGVFAGTTTIPLQPGENPVTGDIPLTVPGLTTGKISYEIIVEPEKEEDNGLFYVFIKANGLFILENKIPRDEVQDVPIERPIFRYIERFKITDSAIITIIEGSSSGPVDLVITDRILKIIDTEETSSYVVTFDSKTESMKITDAFILEVWDPSGKKPVDLVITDTMVQIVDKEEISKHTAKSDNGVDGMKITDDVFIIIE